MEILTSPGYIMQIAFLALAFFTFIKLLSSNVYLYEHRLLPVIVAIIVLHDFYECAIPFASGTDSGILSSFSDMCANVIMFMLVFYFILIRRPKHMSKVITLGIAIMVVANFIKFAGYKLYDLYTPKVDVVCELVILLGFLYTFFASSQKNIFERDDKFAANLMYTAFAISNIGYILHILVHSDLCLMSAIFAINCVIYYYIAYTNRIEDTGVIIRDAVFDVIDTPLVIVNSGFYLVDVNEACHKLFPNGENVSFAFDGGDFRGRFTLGQSLVVKNERDGEYLVDGKWYLASWNVVEEKRGTKGYIFQFTDITSQHEQMQEAKEKTAEKSQFLAEMSHELRSPLHAIIGVSDILLGKHDISTKNRNLVQHIKKASDGLLDVVDSILDFSKLEAGKFTFTEKKYCIADLFEELAYTNIVNLQSKPVDFTFTVSTDYPKYLLGDQLRVREVFQNLLSNAVKFTDKGSISTIVSFERVEDKYCISFTVEDTGVGMSPELARDAFNEYVSESGELEGTGLGLSITKQLVELLGGSIKIESDGFSGTKFSGEIYQKCCDGSMISAQMFNRKNVMNRDGGVNIGGTRTEWIYPGARILVADDMRINQEILTQILSPWKCNVKCVSDGAAAVDAVREQRFDLILLDQMMSPMGGLEAADQIRRISSVPIVLVTANTEDNVQSILLEHAINDYVGKPIHVPNIARVIDQYMPIEYRERNLAETAVNAPNRRDMQNIAVYKKTLETFVKEMQPLLLHLAGYAKDDRDMFKIKVHGIKGVSRQIGRETFGEQAEIMEMAAKAGHWQYVDVHLDEFLSALCDVVEDVTVELTQMIPDDNKFIDEDFMERKPDEQIDSSRTREIFEQLLKAFDEFDIVAIEQGITLLDNISLDKSQTKLYSKIIDAYDELEYEAGSEILTEYLNNN